ncbi:CU044_5270 family protein [Catellatospora citrea]|uniref:CU044_5270 family protein n=1 Tax=Catellatospora citrea TaxID=53366 RepID=UPI003410AAF1
MDIDELVRAARPRTAPGWARSEAGQRVLDGVIAAPPSRSGAVRATPARPARRLLLAGALPAVAVAAAGAVFLTSTTSDPVPHTNGPAPATGSPAPQSSAAASPTRPATPLTARQMLLAAAEQSAAHPVGRGRYWVLRKENGNPVEVGPPDGRYTINERRITELWNATGPVDPSIFLIQPDAGAGPATDADRAAWEADGSPSQWTVPPSSPGTDPVVIDTAAGPWMRRTNTGARPDVKGAIQYYLAGSAYTVEQLAALPTDPRKLARQLGGMIDANGIEIRSNHSLFQAAKELVGDLPATPQVRAAAYRMLAEIKGTQSLGEVTDQHGRRGQAVGFVRRDDGGRWYQTRLIIDPATGQALAEETWDLGSGAKPGKTPKLRSYDLIVRAEFTDEDVPATGDR